MRDVQSRDTIAEPVRRERGLRSNHHEERTVCDPVIDDDAGQANRARQRGGGNNDGATMIDVIKDRPRDNY